MILFQIQANRQIMQNKSRSGRQWSVVWHLQCRKAFKTMAIFFYLINVTVINALHVHRANTDNLRTHVRCHFLRQLAVELVVQNCQKRRINFNTTTKIVKKRFMECASPGISRATNHSKLWALQRLSAEKRSKNVNKMQKMHQICMQWSL